MRPTTLPSNDGYFGAVCNNTINRKQELETTLFPAPALSFHCGSESDASSAYSLSSQWDDGMFKNVSSLSVANGSPIGTRLYVYLFMRFTFALAERRKLSVASQSPSTVTVGGKPQWNDKIMQFSVICIAFSLRVSEMDSVALRY